MKKLLVILFIATLTAGCKKINQYPEQVDLGMKPTSTKISKIYPFITNGPLSVELYVTEGARYSLQVVDISENQMKTFRFTADNAIYIRSLDLSDLKDGDYSLVLLDIDGNETKVNFVIKK